MDKVDHDVKHRCEKEIFILHYLKLDISVVLSMSDEVLSFMVTTIKYLREAD